MGEVFIDANIHLSRDHNTWNAFTDTKSYTMNKACTANAATYNIFLFLVVVIRVILVQVAPQGWLLGLCFFWVILDQFAFWVRSVLTCLENVCLIFQAFKLYKGKYKSE